MKLYGYNNDSRLVLAKGQNKKLKNDTEVSLNDFSLRFAYGLPDQRDCLGKGPGIGRTGVVPKGWVQAGPEIVMVIHALLRPGPKPPP
jgi:hypothetical protein